jgi:diacylglycerol kinase family enzyme
VCIPAGTRNHFALDLGVDRHDVVGALEAFVDGEERRIDLARVNDRVFVNNASIGLYGAIVQSPEYRDAKVRTVLGLLPELVGPEATPFDLRFRGRDGAEHDTAHVVLVSNNAYELDPAPGHGTRGSIDAGTLGVVALELGPPGQGWREEWATPTFRVDSRAAVELGVDGEALVMTPPLEFVSMPGALRVRVARHPRQPALPRVRRPSG